MGEQETNLIHGLMSMLIEKWPAGGYCTRLPWRRGGYPGGSEFMGSWYFENYEDAKRAVLDMATERGKKIHSREEDRQTDIDEPNWLKTLRRS